MPMTPPVVYPKSPAAIFILKQSLYVGISWSMRYKRGISDTNPSRPDPFVSHKPPSARTCTRKNHLYRRPDAHRCPNRLCTGILACNFLLVPSASIVVYHSPLSSVKSVASFPCFWRRAVFVVNPNIREINHLQRLKRVYPGLNRFFHPPMFTSTPHCDPPFLLTRVPNRMFKRIILHTPPGQGEHSAAP